MGTLYVSKDDPVPDNGITYTHEVILGERMDIEEFKKNNCFWCKPLSAWITKKGCFLYRCRTTDAETKARCTPKCPEYKRPTKKEVTEYERFKTRTYLSKKKSKSVNSE